MSKTRAVSDLGADWGVSERFRGSETAQRRLSGESESPQGDSLVTSQGHVPGAWGPYKLYPA